jgi:hypothetical protein
MVSSPSGPGAITMKHATTRMLFSYWDALRGERMAPERGEIEPGHIRHILADTFILEITSDALTTFRLAGTRLCALFGKELKTQEFSSLWRPEESREADRVIDIVAMESAGLVAGLTGKTSHGQSIELEMLLLPLRHRGRTQSRLLGAVSPLSVPDWIGIEHITGIGLGPLRVIWPSSERESLQAPAAFARSPLERRRRFVLYRGGLETA